MKHYLCVHPTNAGDKARLRGLGDALAAEMDVKEYEVFVDPKCPPNRVYLMPEKPEHPE